MKKLLLLSLSLIVLFSNCKKDNKATLASITTTPATNITTSTAQGGGEITGDGGSPVTKRGVCWAIHTSPTVADSMTIDGGGTGAFQSNLTKLLPNTTYYIRAYAINSTGTAYGNEVNITSAKGLPVLTTTAITDIAPLTAKSGGNIIADGGASITARGVCWSTSPNPTTANFKTSDGTGIGVFTSTMNNLASQGTYYIRAYATNSFGTSYGNELSLTASVATINDVDGNVYQYVDLCGKKWMTSNLKTKKYKNGDAIVDGSTVSNWAGYSNGAYLPPNGDAANVLSYGLLYNTFAVVDSRGLCPAGWHVPTDDEWKSLEICQGMTQADADLTDLRGSVGGTMLEGGSSGLNLKKGGFALKTGGPFDDFYDFNTKGYYLSSTVQPGGGLSYWYRGFNFSGPDPIFRQYSRYVMSVRCVKD